MNDKPDTLAEQDDAAFRARLAPLASEVLPSPPAATARETPSLAARMKTEGGSARPGVLAVLLIVSAVVVLGVASLRSKWPWSAAPVVTASPSGPVGIPATPSGQISADAMIDLLVRRGNAALTDGDVMGARLLFERAAAMGSAAAATSAGKTYDNEFLLRAGARGIRADQEAATAWYRRAAALGDAEARTRLARTDATSRP